EEAALFIDGIAFGQAVERNLCLPFQMQRIRSIEYLKRFRRVRATARCRSSCDPEFLRCCDVDYAVASHAIRRNRHTIPAPKCLCIDYANSPVAAIADVNHAVTNGGRGWANHYFPSASLNFASSKSCDLRHGICLFIDHVYAPCITCRHPQFSSRPIIREI